MSKLKCGSSTHVDSRNKILVINLGASFQGVFSHTGIFLIVFSGTVIILENYWFILGLSGLSFCLGVLLSLAIKKIIIESDTLIVHYFVDLYVFKIRYGRKSLRGFNKLELFPSYESSRFNHQSISTVIRIKQYRLIFRSSNRKLVLCSYSNYQKANRTLEKTGKFLSIKTSKRRIRAPKGK